MLSAISPQPSPHFSPAGDDETCRWLPRRALRLGHALLGSNKLSRRMAVLFRNRAGYRDRGYDAVFSTPPVATLLKQSQGPIRRSRDLISGTALVRNAGERPRGAGSLECLLNRHPVFGVVVRSQDRDEPPIKHYPGALLDHERATPQ
jgi:hypothetical protein